MVTVKVSVIDMLFIFHMKVNVKSGLSLYQYKHIRTSLINLDTISNTTLIRKFS
jgi:hypothetical protein